MYKKKIPWSPEHGATAVAFSSWLMILFAVGSSFLSAIMDLVLLASLVNLPWLWRLKGRAYRLQGLMIYALLALVSSTWMIFYHPLWIFVLSGLALSALLYEVFIKFEWSKGIVLQFLGFASLSAGALLAIHPEKIPDQKTILFIWLSSTLWFSYSSLLLKLQKKNQGKFFVLLYPFATLFGLYLVDGKGSFGIFILLLLHYFLKDLAGEGFNRKSMRRRGFIEFAWALLFVFVESFTIRFL